MTRLTLLAAVTAAVFLSTAAAASAATYLVDTTGADVGDCTVVPCATIQYAIDQHRLSPAPDDVIDVAAGDYAQNVDATDPADDGLLIRGELSGGGNPATFVEGDGSTGAPGCISPCIAALGATPDTEVTMQNLEVNQDSTDTDSDLSPIFLNGGSDLNTVDVEVIDTNTFAGVELCTDPGSTFEDVFVDATGTDASGISGCAAVKVTDSAIFTDDSPALDVGGDPAETTEVTRSWLSAADDSPNFAAFITSPLKLDSSLVTGGSPAVFIPGSEGVEIDVNNSTIDAADAGIADDPAFFLGRFGSDPIEVTIDSSIVVDEIEVDGPPVPLTLTCEYSNLFDVVTPPDTTGFTDNCPLAGTPGSTNTDVDPDDLFNNPLFGDWSLQSGSPAIDAGQPGAVPAGFSPTDIDGDPRRVPGTAATCPDGVRDQGAFEAPAVSCNRTLSVSTSGTGTGTVTGPGIDCGGAGHTDCSETVAIGAAIELTASPAADSTFDGFTGGGCSANPCTVTLDTDKSVQARFTSTGATHPLQVELIGQGRGLVTGPGIDCGNAGGHGDCGEIYPAGTQVTLTATPEKGSEFSGFGGTGCGSSPCSVTMDASRALTAEFDRTTSPRTTFDKRPKKPWPEKPVFKLRSSERGSSFECKVDDGAWEDCSKRVKLRGLDTGQHKFRARATNADGVTGPHTSDRFRIPR